MLKIWGVNLFGRSQPSEVYDSFGNPVFGPLSLVRGPNLCWLKTQHRRGELQTIAKNPNVASLDTYQCDSCSTIHTGLWWMTLESNAALEILAEIEWLETRMFWLNSQ